ncbi:DUF1553 domain-containing protein [Haloferula sp. A504]|uniref:DUF1553 domain-containing protein n=1 Tax=Haloferula sp. A504 TaxID=3373601 RepID=UPI0031C5457E|nr:DUF1549 and DUF1553 domain-containing protein [Verrucomicrobiaceae bacterium E54]
MKPISIIWLAIAWMSSGWVAAVESGPVQPFETDRFAVAPSEIDRLAFAAMREAGVEPALPCSDEVFLRRVHLDVAGRIPTLAETRAFLRDPSKDRRSRLIDRLLESDDHVDYWTMHWCDVLRVKSEFPINLWPDAVQAYHRWIREQVAANRPYDEMATEMLTASGSNFRDPAVNFYRAVPGKGPEPIAAAVALTFMGCRIEHWPQPIRTEFGKIFARLAFKPTAEWKEEIVCPDPACFDALDVRLPDHHVIHVAPGEDGRVPFAAWLIAQPRFAEAGANRVWAWVFGRGIVHEPDDLRPENPAAIPGLLEHLGQAFAADGYDSRKLLRRILHSRLYQLSSIPRSESSRVAELFAAYPVRRLEAEVLLDTLCDLTGTREGYMSPIPEPFTHVPPSARSVRLADGSITSPFLEMFGRSSRDSGHILERNNQVSDAQMLYLLNSTELQNRLARSPKLRALTRGKGSRKADQVVEAVYLSLLSRRPTHRESVAALGDRAATRAPAPPPPQQLEDLVWALVNSKEFLHRH